MRVLWQDLKFGCRLLVAQRRFSLVAILTLALIGAGEWSVDKMRAKSRSHVWGYAAPGGERPGLDEE